VRLLDSDDQVLEEQHMERWDTADEHAIADIVNRFPRPDAVGHRVVHGGDRYNGPTRLSDKVEAGVAELTPLAPLHQPRALAAIRAVATALSDIPAVACFDTAFHTTLSAAAATYALPGEWRDRWGLHRFGFHGLSHAYAVSRTANMLGSHDGRLRVVSCHLGAGASLCAAVDGQSVDTTMGFTPLEGLVMATRSGSVDPGLVLWLITRAGLAPAEVGDGLERRSGLAGLSGGSGDMRDLLASRRRGETDAMTAFDVYVHRLVREIAAMTAALGGIDVLAFTGGVGEGSPEVRAETGSRLGYLGVEIDPEKNTGSDGADAEIGVAAAPVRTVVVQSREDLEIARQTRSLLSPSGSGAR
jgi:acetate kinase